MDRAEIVRHLRKIPLFQKVPFDEFKAGGRFFSLLPLVHEQRYETGEVIFHQGQPANRLYYVVEGRVRLTSVGQDAVTRYLETLEPGDSMGETGLLLGDFHDATAETLTATTLLYLERAPFAEFRAEQSGARRLLNLNSETRRRLSMPEFDWLREGELVVFTARRHWAHLVKRIGPAIVLLLVLVIVGFMLLYGNSNVHRLIWLGLGLVTAPLLIFIGWHVVDWQNDFFVLTTDRIVHYEHVWLIRREFEEGLLENIQDINLIQIGILANALNYGDIILQTAGTAVDIDLTGVARPQELRNLISQELERSRARRVAVVRYNIRENLEERLETGQLPAKKPKAEEAPPAFSPAVLAAKTFLEYFFPPSRSESADGSAIYWRRYWLPGFLHNWHISLLWAGWTIAGILFRGKFSFQNGGLFLLLGWLLGEALLFAVLLWTIEDWRNDYFELLPGRIVLISQRPLLLQRSQLEARLEDIQNLRSEVPSFLGQIFRYGHVMFETASAQGVFELKWVRFPEDVRNEISRRQQAYSIRQQKAEAQRRQDELLQWFDVYDELRNPDHRRANTASQSMSGEEVDAGDEA